MSDHITETVCFKCGQPGHTSEYCLTRTYTESDLCLARAQALREAAEMLKGDADNCSCEISCLICSTRQTDSKRILARIDQLALDKHDAELVAPIQAVLERDRTKVAECLTAVKSELNSYSWLIDSRGSYEWNDDRWHEEFKRVHEAITKSIEPMVKIAADWSNCPKTWAEVQKARGEE